MVAFTRAVAKRWAATQMGTLRLDIDVVDTANGYLIKQRTEFCAATEFIACRKTAVRFKTPIGPRGIHAGITSFGLKWVLWCAKCAAITRFGAACKDVGGKISI